MSMANASQRGITAPQRISANRRKTLTAVFMARLLASTLPATAVAEQREQVGPYDFVALVVERGEVGLEISRSELRLLLVRAGH